MNDLAISNINCDMTNHTRVTTDIEYQIARANRIFINSHTYLCLRTRMKLRLFTQNELSW